MTVVSRTEGVFLVLANCRWVYNITSPESIIWPKLFTRVSASRNCIYQHCFGLNAKKHQYFLANESHIILLYSVRRVDVWSEDVRRWGVCIYYYVCLLDDRPCGRLTFPVGVEPDENALCSFVISSCYLACDVYLREEFTEYTHTHTRARLKVIDRASLRAEYYSHRWVSLILKVLL